MMGAGRLCLILLLLGHPVHAETLRVATYNASLTRSGPGLLLQDILRGKSRQIANVAAIIREVRPDILLLNEFDHDLDAVALDAFRTLLAGSSEGIDYPYYYAGPSNTGLPSGVDLDGDGTTTDPADAYGFGRFPGQYGMALLSRFPIDPDQTRSFQNLLWSGLPDAQLPTNTDGSAFPSPEAHAAFRLSSKSHWDVSIATPDGPLRIFASHPTPPVFDGPEDANGLRNHDEITFWTRYLDGYAPVDDQGRTSSPGKTPFVILGDLNADPMDGDGRLQGIRALLSHPRVTDPEAKSAGALQAARDQKGANTKHKGDPALDTSDWNDTRGPGNLRVDYALPSSDLVVEGAGVFWPDTDDPKASLLSAGKRPTSDHHLVWVDISFPDR